MERNNVQSILQEESSVISDPISWQMAVNNAPGGINLRGSSRFWATVEALSNLEVIYRDGVPDFSEIVFRLKGNIGLRLYTDHVSVAEFAPDDHDVPIWIRFAFCEITDE